MGVVDGCGICAVGGDRFFWPLGVHVARVFLAQSKIDKVEWIGGRCDGCGSGEGR